MGITETQVYSTPTHTTFCLALSHTKGHGRTDVVGAAMEALLHLWLHPHLPEWESSGGFLNQDCLLCTDRVYMVSKMFELYQKRQTKAE